MAAYTEVPMDEKKIHVLQGGASPDHDAEAIRKLRGSMPYLIQHMALMAELHRAKFDALKKQGFSDSQAIELCKQIF